MSTPSLGREFFGTPMFMKVLPLALGEAVSCCTLAIFAPSPQHTCLINSFSCHLIIMASPTLAAFSHDRSDDDLNAFQTTLLPVAGQSSSDVVNYSIVYHFAKTPIRLSTICRQVHAALTGPKARQRDQIDARRLREAWDGLEQAWEELEDLRQLPTANVMQPEDVNRFVNGWQVSVHQN